jgi:hypothetical protein
MRLKWLLVLLIPTVGLSQVKVTSTLDSTSIITGDQFRLSIKVAYPLDGSIVQVDLSELNNANFIEVLGEKDYEVLKTDNGNFFEKELTLTSFDTGYHFIPKIPVVISVGNALDTFYSTSPAFEVALLPLESADVTLMPIKEIIKEPIGLEDILPYLAGILLGAFLIGLFLFIKKRRGRKNLEANENKDSRTPYQRAIQRLEALDVTQYLAEGTIKEFHFELSFIFRGYLEEIYKQPALESTLKEVKEIVRLIGLEQEVLNSFFKNMEKAEMIKFAKLQTDAGFHMDFYNQVKRVINLVNLQEEEKTLESQLKADTRVAKKLNETEENSEEA